MTIVADLYNYVVVVDTHARTHSYAIVAAATGAVLAQATFPTTPAGLGRALAWIRRRTSGLVLISAEGTGSYGAQLAELATDHRYRVVEAPTPPAARIRGKGKSDPTDAVLAARATVAQTMDQVRDRRVGGDRAAVQALITRRDQLTTQRTASVNALTALLRTHDLGIDARTGLTAAVIAQIAAWRARTEDHHRQVLRALAIDYAREIRDLGQRLVANQEAIAPIVAREVPELLDIYGISTINAAVIYTVWSHLGRIRTQAAFASIAGTNPIPVHSGNTHHYRLNRGGDRRLNQALHSIMISRCRLPETKAYITKRQTEGMDPRNARRCLKNYIARQIWRTLTNAHQPDIQHTNSALLTAA